ncbi:hypothetical protein HYALB_00006833 [Hymenoscyphus albidus]|uniref:Cytochrome P450 n=1 Tax=Hymenoscyphus albidus TaxID=595503 RepID=A0A9N9LHL9_9HELO|nr:hypothetical protein HYALB_00006833 [Hymenoscyphus albidus]
MAAQLPDCFDNWLSSFLLSHLVDDVVSGIDADSEAPTTIMDQPMVTVWKIWKMGYEPFQEAGTDTFILSTPSGNMLWSSDNAIIRDLFTHHPNVDAPVEFWKFWNVYGPTIASVQGNEWKAHRRAVTAGFGPNMNQTVWKETQHQTETLAKHWIEKYQAIIPVIRYWTSRLALNIICSGFFGMKVKWDSDDAAPLPAGHNIPLDEALPKFIENLAVYFTVPTALLGKLPVKKFQDTYQNFTEITSYLDEFRAQVLDNVEAVTAKKNKNILESVVLAGVNGKDPLPKESVLGNIFFSLLAGHETNGGTLGFIYLLMAIYPEYQQRMQKELDNQLGTRPASEWTLENDYPVLKRGFLGAIQKEVLYVFNPASFIMRKALNPVTLVDSHALYIDPERWLDENDQDLATATSFGAGGRVCPGKEFANVELTASMTTLFKSYSMELVVEKNTVDECGGDEKLAWKQTRDKAIKMIYDDLEANITIGIHKDIRTRIVKRA